MSERAGEGSTSRVGRPARVSREAIAEAVLSVGFDAATAKSVGAHLGVDPSTLYGHVAHRADMLELAADRAIANHPWPTPSAAWRDLLTSYAEAVWALLEDTPGLARYLRTMAGAPASLTSVGLTVIRAFAEQTRISPAFAALVIDTVGDLIVDSHLTVTTLNTPVAGDHRGRTGREIGEQALVETLGEGDDVAEYARIFRDAMGTTAAGTTWWRAKLDLVLDGVAYRLRETHNP